LTHQVHDMAKKEELDPLSIKRHVNIPTPIDRFIVNEAINSGFSYTHVLGQMLLESKERWILQREALKREFGIK
jgi:hypothetical protein